MRPLTSLTVTLAIINIGLVGAGAWLVTAGERRIHETVDVQLSESPPLRVLLPTHRRASRLDPGLIRDQVAFYKGRSFYQAPPPAQTISLPEYQLAGVMTLPTGKRTAFLMKVSDRSTRTVHVGDPLDGWRVEDISSNRVVAVSATETAEINASPTSLTQGLVRTNGGPRLAQSVEHATAATHVDLPTVAHSPPHTYQPPPQ